MLLTRLGVEVDGRVRCCSSLAACLGCPPRSAASLHRILRMKSSKKKTSVAQGGSRAQTRREKEATRRLKAPRWNFWLAKPDVSLRQAALLTMGLAPEPGIVTLLKTKPRRFVEFKRREQALETAYGESEWLPRRATLPRTTAVRGALEFASEAEWVLAKTAISALGRLRHLHPIVRPQETGTNCAKNVVPLAVANPPTQASSMSQLATTVRIESDAMSKKDQRMQRVLGATLILLQRVAEAGKSPQYLRNKKLNVSAVANKIIALVEEEEEASHTLQGFSLSSVDDHIAAALKLFSKTYSNPELDLPANPE